MSALARLGFEVKALARRGAAWPFIGLAWLLGGSARGLSLASVRVARFALRVAGLDAKVGTSA